MEADDSPRDLQLNTNCFGMADITDVADEHIYTLLQSPIDDTLLQF